MSGYIWAIRFLPLIIAINKDSEVQIYIDGAYTVHIDGKGHSGIFLMIGKGRMMNVSKKLGLVTISSTKMEVVADRECFPAASSNTFI